MSKPIISSEFQINVTKAVKPRYMIGRQWEVFEKFSEKENVCLET